MVNVIIGPVDYGYSLLIILYIKETEANTVMFRCLDVAPMGRHPCIRLPLESVASYGALLQLKDGLPKIFLE